jgi:hypothetical protein
MAQMSATSVIDTVASNMMIVERGGGTVVPLGGIAHAGARGISRVQIRAADGSRRNARLRSPLSATTWVIWRYDWPFQPGRHTFTVRCIEGRQRRRRHRIPAGATGFHSKSAML